MKLKEILARLTPIEMHAEPELEIGDVCYDSRRVRPGDLFVAVRGLETDGHRYVDAAVRAGAACVLCEEAPNGDVPYVIVPDTRIGLARAGAAVCGYPAEKMKIIGVTGTNGKTTSTTLLRQVLQTCTGEKCGLIGTNVNYIGDTVEEAGRTTPESLELQRLLARMVEAGCTRAVMEVSSHALSLQRVDGIRFDVGLFTNLTQDHLDYHGTMDNYAEAKAKLFRHCRVGGINGDDPYAERMAENAACRIWRWSARENGEIRAEEQRLYPDRVTFTARGPWGSVPVTLHIPGEFSVYNALTVLTGAWLSGVDAGESARVLEEMSGVKGRAETVPTGRNFSVIIDYAHTPDALENILNTLRACTGGKLAVLFGCGGDRDRTKRPIMGEIASRLADRVYVTSDNPRTEDPEEIIREILPGVRKHDTETIVLSDRRAAIGRACREAGEGDILLLAGKGHETYQEINHVKHHMDEREIVADVLREMDAEKERK